MSNSAGLAGNSARMTSPLDSLFPGGILALFFIFSATVLGALYYLIERHETAELEDAMVRSAEITVQSISDFRSYYSTEILGNLDDTDIPVTHEFRDVPGSLPLPATMSIELGDYLDDQGGELGYRMFSDLPFPWREGRELDGFEREALDRFGEGRSDPFFRFEEVDGVLSFRFASAVPLQESCIGCHNAHPESPRSDWRAGDIRGVQEIILPVAQTDFTGGQEGTFWDIIVFVVVSFGSATGFVLILARRNRHAFAELRQMAEREHSRAQALQDSQARVEEGFGRLNAVLENVADAVISIDHEGRIESANTATEKIFGYPSSYLIGKNVSLLMPEEIAEKHSNFLERYLTSGKSSIMGVGRELEGRRHDGSYFPMELSLGEVLLEDRVLFTGIIRDITKRKEVEQSLRDSERRSRTLSLVADRTDNAVIITDAKGYIEWVNEGFERVSGFCLGEVIGRKPGEFLQGPETDPAAVSDIRSRICDGLSFHSELINYTKAGTPYWVQIDAQPVLGANRDVEYYIAIERDVTEAKKREAQLDEALQYAEEANAAKSRFLAMMSHEIRTPLNGVLGTLGLLEETAQSDDDRQLLKTGKNAGETLVAIINDLLDVSRLDSDIFTLEKAVFEPRHVAHDVIEALKIKAEEKDLDLRVSISPDIPSFIRGDEARIRQILINLIGNAIKFTDHGFVELELLISKNRRGDECIKAEIRDSGRGIKSDDLPLLFEEFWRASDGRTRTTEGTGLGLAICNKLVELMGGEIHAASALGKGSTFTVLLPIEHASKEEIDRCRLEQSESLEEDDDGFDFSSRILVAEDSSANQIIIRAMLERLGVSVDIVGDGTEALEALESRPYDIVMMDINMPTMNGVDATRRIRSRHDSLSDIPVIAMTAYSMKGDREEFLRDGLSDYISKPIRKNDLVSILRKWIAAVRSEDSFSGAEEHTAERCEISTLNHTILRELFDAAGQDMARHVLDVYSRDLEIGLQALKTALEASDCDSIHKQAHVLKGASASVGAQELAAAFEVMQHDPSIQNAANILPGIRRLSEEARTEISRAIDRHFRA